MVKYTYDSWGKVLSVIDAEGNEITDEYNIGLVNPFRYRGYYYDYETGYYYLKTRYYNPEWGRFLNADGTLWDQNANLMGHNMYAYGANNPINNIDPNGKSILIGTVIGVTATFFGIALLAQTLVNVNNVNTAASMFVGSIAGSGLSESSKQNIIAKTQKSSELKGEISKAIKSSNGKNFKANSSINYTSGDMYLALGHVNVDILGTKNQDNSWNVSVKISDKYDFTEWREGWSFGTIMNNVGYTMQAIEALTPYEWDVSYNFVYWEN